MRELLVDMILLALKSGKSIRELLGTPIYHKEFLLEVVTELRDRGLSSQELLSIIKDIYF